MDLRLKQLDVLRGVAILLVLGRHIDPPAAGMLPSVGLVVDLLRQIGWMGVDLFFVLSGFLVSGLIFKEHSTSGAFRTKRFLIRRAFKIYPLYYLLLLLGLAWLWPTLHTYPAGPSGTAFAEAIFMQNYYPGYGYYPLGHTWSLAVEEHFYLAWPAVVRKLSSAALAKTILVIILFEPVARAVSFAMGWAVGISYYTWLVADGLAIGAALALYVRSPQFSRRGLATISGGLATLAILMLKFGAPYGILTRLRLLGAALQLTSVNMLFAGLLGITLLLGTSRYAFLVKPAALRFFGNISYGLYLIHCLPFYWYDDIAKAYWPGLSEGRAGLILMRFIIASAAAVLAAALSRRYFEEPFLRLKDKFAV